MRKVLLWAGLLLSCAWVSAREPVKVACVGNSITYGIGVENREQDSYPAQLQRLLGEEYVVGNFGKPGATLLNQGHLPYTQQPEYADALAFAADIVVIHLGINDTDPRNWPNYRDSFIPDYRALIDAFRAAKPGCRILIARMTPITYRHARFETGTHRAHVEIQQAIETVARTAEDVQLIDFHEPLYVLPFLLDDSVHPDEEGAAWMAKTVYEGITGDFGGLQLPELFSDNMVLPAGKAFEIHGKADAGESVSVSVGEQRHAAVAGADGKWTVTLRPLDAGGPYTLAVSTGTRDLVYENVLAGEIWLCSGQSNMEFTLDRCATAAEDIPHAACPEIRLYDMKARWRTDATEWPVSVLDSVNRLQYYAPTTWTVCSPETAACFSAVAYHFGKTLQDSLQVPVGLICNAVGGSPTEAWVERSVMEREYPGMLHPLARNGWAQNWVRERAAQNTKLATTDPQRHPYEACYLFESGIRPLERFPLTGVIWYQGESNDHLIEAHENLFRLLVESWRTNWQNPEMPFYFVQLSGMDRPAWPWFRDSQRRLMEQIPHTGMAVCSDKGDSLDVHPTQKKEVGMRLAAWALNQTYGHANVVPSGPLFRSVRFDGQDAYVSFAYAQGLGTSDGEPVRTFELAGEDGLFYPATAVIAGDEVKLRSEQVTEPKKVRYGWQPFTRANLVNGAGLPASTFRSDTQ